MMQGPPCCKMKGPRRGPWSCSSPWHLGSVFPAVTWLFVAALCPLTPVVSATGSNFQCQEYTAPTDRIDIGRHAGNLVEIHVRHNIQVGPFAFSFPQNYSPIR